MVRKMLVANRKGGVGKTTTAWNLGYELAKKGFKVLLHDFDVQANLSKYAGRLDTEFYIGDILKDHKFDVRKAIYPALINGEEQENLHIVPARAGDALTKLEMDMISITKREERLNMQLQKLGDDYDFHLFDTDPSASVLSLNAIVGANEFLFPTEMSDNSLEGIGEMLSHIAEVTFKEEDDIKFIILPCKVPAQEKTAIDYGQAYISELWPNNMAKTWIWNRAAFRKAEADNMPVSMFAPGDNAAMFYKDLAKELVA